jgi:hypothetical protein
MCNRLFVCLLLDCRSQAQGFQGPEMGCVLPVYRSERGLLWVSLLPSCGFAASIRLGVSGGVMLVYLCSSGRFELMGMHRHRQHRVDFMEWAPGIDRFM